MTIREAQELIKFTDEKSGRRKQDAKADKDAVCARFREVLREANDAGIDLTAVLVDSLGEKIG